MMRPENHKQSRKKPWFLSLTLWANVLCVLCIVIEEYLHLLRPLLGDHAFAVLTIIVATVNLYFRVFTSRGLLFLGYPEMLPPPYGPVQRPDGVHPYRQQPTYQQLPVSYPQSGTQFKAGTDSKRLDEEEEGVIR